MRSIVNAWIVDMKHDQKETMTCQIMTAAGLKPNPVERKSVAVHENSVWKMPQ
jgi:hypothetical protein